MIWNSFLAFFGCLFRGGHKIDREATEKDLGMYVYCVKCGAEFAKAINVDDAMGWTTGRDIERELFDYSDKPIIEVSE